MPDSDDANASEIFRAAQCERRIAAAFPARVQSGYANARTDHCRQRARGTRASGRCAILLQAGPEAAARRTRAATGCGCVSPPTRFAMAARQANRSDCLRHRRAHRRGSSARCARGATRQSRSAHADGRGIPGTARRHGAVLRAARLEPEEVARACAEHYQPRFSGDTLPSTLAGVAVALADKLETLVGLFGIGQCPTSDKDPFALRRAALGLLRILLEKALPLDLEALLRLSFEQFGAVPSVNDP